MKVEDWLQSSIDDPHVGVPFPDRASWPHDRLRKALADGNASAVDLVVLLRAVLRSESLDRGYAWEFAVPKPFALRLESELNRAGIESVGDFTLRARPWRPSWLAGTEVTDVDACVRPTLRRPPELCAGDPNLSTLGLQHYTSSAQRDAVRAVFCAQPGDTLAICLPTGSGKSVCAFLPSLFPLHADTGARGVSVIVVPTIALALDLEKRMQEGVGHPIAYRPEKPTEAEAIRDRCAAGIQGPVIVSPEALVGGLLGALRTAAKEGSLRQFVVDEAHIVLSWGDEFRPAFLRLAAVRRDLALRAQKRGFVTLLMSATLTDYHLRWLGSMFAEANRFRIVHAARLRPEPAFWIASAAGEDERASWIEEAIFQLPRPAIVYTTRRDDCERWHRRFRELGFRRIGVMTGGTSDDARRTLLDQWNADKLDLVVATSAFGLGVDKAGVRTILHAQLPESVDRFYQDVGRAGRDGNASLSLLITTPRDWPRVSGLGNPRFITAHRGLERWRRMYQAKEMLDPGTQTVLVNLLAARELDMTGDYNRNWNIRTLQLLQRAGALDFISDERENFNHVAVRPCALQHLHEEFWNTTIETLRGELAADYRRAKALLQRLTRVGAECLSELFADCYASETFGLSSVKACGGCPVCRSRATQPSCGKMLARRVPPDAMPGEVPGPDLSKMLAGRNVAFIGYSSRFDGDELASKSSDLLWWLATQGVRNFVIPSSLTPALDELAQAGRHFVLFRHDRPPRALDVTAHQPTAIFLTRPEPTWWRDFRVEFCYASGAYRSHRTRRFTLSGSSHARVARCARLPGLGFRGLGESLRRMKIYTTFEPVPSRVLAVARLLLVTGALPEDEAVGLLQPREDTSMAKKTLDAAVECGLVRREKKVCQLAAGLFPAKTKADELDDLLSLVIAPMVLAPEVARDPNGFATLCAWLLHQPVLGMPPDRGGLKKAIEEQGFTLAELQIQNDQRWDNVSYWGRYLGLVRQTREEPCGGLVPDPTVFLRRHLAQLLPACEEVEAAVFRTRLGTICPVLDGGAARDRVLARIASDWPAPQLSDALSFAIERLERTGEVRAWCPNDQRTFLVTPAGRKIAYLERMK